MREEGNKIIYEENDNMTNTCKICNYCVNSMIPQIRFRSYFIKSVPFRYEYSTCPCCNQSNFLEINIDYYELAYIVNMSSDSKFVFYMLSLKENNPEEYNIKIGQCKYMYEMNQIESTIAQSRQSQIVYNTKPQQMIPPTEQSNVPKCPTCGSTNIKKISATKRYVSTGLFGLASSDLGHTQQCNDCGYKW